MTIYLSPPDLNVFNKQRTFFVTNYFGQIRMGLNFGGKMYSQNCNSKSYSGILLEISNDLKYGNNKLCFSDNFDH